MTKKNLIRIALIGITSIMISGCTAKGPQFNGFKKPTQGKANVYIYRTSLLAPQSTPYINEKNLRTGEKNIVGYIKPNGYIMTTIKPGTYEFWARTEVKNEIYLTAKANNIYCIKHYMSFGFFSPHPQFKLVDMKKCKKEIAQTRLSLQD
jgi:hypothetical protein